MDGLQLWGCELRLSFVCFEGVGDVKLFEEPEDALGAGFFEPRGWGGVSEVFERGKGKGGGG